MDATTLIPLPHPPATAVGSRQTDEPPHLDLLLDALKTRPDVCLCLDRLAGSCPSVRAYVKDVNTSGRVLRLFHAAKAQMIYYEARRQVQKDREEAAVGRVHAINT